MLHTMVGPTVAIDIGGTYTRVAVVDPPDTAQGRPLAGFAAQYRPLARFATRADYSAEIEALTSVLRAAGGPLPGFVGVSLGARMVRDGTQVAAALNLPQYEGQPLPADLASVFGCPVRVAHDATCGLLAEHGFGALRGFDRCAYVTLSTGTGAALRLGGADHGVVLTTEAGHQIVPGNDRRCLCGQRGCLDTLTGGNQIERYTGTAPDGIHDEIFWAAYARSVAVGLANTALISGVDAVALGGGIVLNRPGLLDALTAELATTLRYQSLTVVSAHLGDSAPLVGAAALLTTRDQVLH
jgi:glucokinase